MYTGLVSSRRRVEVALWVVAVITFGVIDTVVTVYALTEGIAEEGNPFPRWWIDTHSETALIVLKACFMGGYYLAYRVIDEPIRIGIPVGLAIVGVPVSIWNVYLVFL